MNRRLMLSTATATAAATSFVSTGKPVLEKAGAADGVHPTQTGHTLMAKTWRSAVGL
jgi:phospholipase/lecithinase/hemolysin